MNKYTIAAIVMGILCARAETLISDGARYFPVLVQVLSAEGTPVSDAEVRLTDFRGRGWKPNLSEPATKPFEDALGSTVKTDERGCAIVWFLGRFGHTYVDGKPVKYSQSLEGTLVIRHGNKEVYRKMLGLWAPESGYRPRGNDAPWVEVTLEDKAQQGVGGQPATPPRVGD